MYPLSDIVKIMWIKIMAVPLKVPNQVEIPSLFEINCKERDGSSFSFVFVLSLG